MNAHNLETVCELLSWIMSSFTPLTLNELVEAISIERDDSERDLSKMVTNPNDLIEMLGSLVVVDRTRQDPVAALAHFTVEQFLRSDQLRKHDSLSMFCVTSIGVLNVGLAFVQYPSFTDFMKPCRTVSELQSRILDYKLLCVASNYWLAEMRTYGGRGPLIRKSIPILRWFIDGCRGADHRFVSWQQEYHRSLSGLPPPNPLRYAMHLGLVNLLDIIIQKGTDTRVMLSMGYSSLVIAVIGGHDDIVASLLGGDATINLEERYQRGSTYLHLAAGYGHDSIVSLLLEAGASPYALSDSGSTPFYRAARSASIPTMALLLDAGSDIDAETCDNWTPIIEAIESQHVEAVVWLVSKGANLNQETRSGTSVLGFARYAGTLEIIRSIEDGLRSR
jgi:ankyrin repeat protein